MLFTNTWLTPAIGCESQSTAYNIEISWGMIWIGVKCVFQENVSSMN